MAEKNIIIVDDRFRYDETPEIDLFINGVLFKKTDPVGTRRMISPPGAFRDGYNRGVDDSLLEQNLPESSPPFPLGTKEANEWLDGYRKARLEKNESQQTKNQIENCTTCKHHNVHYDDHDFDGCTCSNPKLNSDRQVEFHRYCDDTAIVTTVKTGREFDPEKHDGECPHWELKENL